MTSKHFQVSSIMVDSNFEVLLSMQTLKIYQKLAFSGKLQLLENYLYSKLSIK